MPKTEQLLHKLDALRETTGIPRTIFAACPNSPTVIRASLRAAKRNNAPIYFAATLNQIDCDGGYTGMTQEDFVRTVRFETERVNFTGDVIIAIDHGGPWLKDKQRTEKWSVEDAMNGVKKSFEAAVLAGYDLIHVDPTVDINVPKGQIIDIHVVAARTVELIAHVEKFRKEHGIAPISYEVGTEEVHGGLADETTFDTFISDLKNGLMVAGLPDVWPCFIVGKVGTDLDTTIFDGEVARRLTSKVRPLGSYIKGHYTDDVANPEEYPLCGMGAANVGPEFTISEYRALCELEQLEKKFHAEGKVAVMSHMKEVLLQEVNDSHRWEKWLHEEIGTHITFWPSTFGGHEGFAFITSRADDHQEGPHILADDFGCLGNAQRSVTFHTGMGQPKTDQKQLVIKHFSVFAMKVEGMGYGSE